MSAIQQLFNCGEQEFLKALSLKAVI